MPLFRFKKMPVNRLKKGKIPKVDHNKWLAEAPFGLSLNFTRCKHADTGCGNTADLYWQL